jgi:thioredoxin-related protein
MKKIIVLLALIIPFFCQAQESGVKFEQNLSWTQVKAKAKAENKYVFVDCYATWCGPCKMMDRDVYPDTSVGNVVNSHFISVKVQMDKTASDNDEVKSWYADADHLMKEGQISAFPSFLFYSPDGKIVYSEIGYRTAKGFTQVTKNALDPEKMRLYTDLEDYRHNKKNYPVMGQLATFVRSIVGDKDLAQNIAKDYKENYLEKKAVNELCNYETLDFIRQFPLLTNSRDPFFAMFLKSSGKIDSMMKFPGLSKIMVERTITREELTDQVVKNDKPLLRKPDWQNLQQIVANKYPSIDAHRLTLNYELTYYQKIDLNWSIWARIKDQVIKDYPPSPKDEMSIYTDINGFGGAWLAFLKCNDKKILKKALEWEDLAIKLVGPGQQYLDTKANLLYKLGYKSQALVLERQAYALNNKATDLKNAIAKMEKDEPTYVDQGAVWSKELLPIKSENTIKNKNTDVAQK